jgi:hypothetical protein
LIEAVLGHGAVALSVGVHSVFVTRGSAIEPDPEPHWLAVGCRAKDQVKIPGVEAEDNGARRGNQRRMLAAHVPLSAQGPLICREPWRGSVGMRLVFQDRLRRDVVLLPGIAKVRLGRQDVSEIRRGLSARRLWINQAGYYHPRVALAEQLLDHLLGLGIIALAEMVIPMFPFESTK